MAKLSKEQIQTEVKSKGFGLVDAAGYTNMQSPISVQCSKGHMIETNLETIRKPSFVCPVCDGANFEVKVTGQIPEKNGFRIVAFDQATEKLGISVYDGGKLVHYDLFRFTGDLATRLVKIRSLIEDVVIPQWKPDFVVFEDIQYQGPNIMTFKTLSMLLGVCEVACRSKGVDYDLVLSKVWRSHVGVGGRSREEQKKAAVAKVHDLLGLYLMEDVAEAILIGKFAASQKKSKKLF